MFTYICQTDASIITIKRGRIIGSFVGRIWQLNLVFLTLNQFVKRDSLKHLIVLVVSCRFLYLWLNTIITDSSILYGHMMPNIRLSFLPSSRVSQPFLIQDFNPAFFFDMNEIPSMVITCPYCRKSLHRTEKHTFMHDLSASMIILCTQNEVVTKTVCEL